MAPKSATAPTGRRVDFSQTPMASYYSPLYALVIDNCLTPAECAHLLHEAESRSEAGWEAAQVNIGRGRQEVDLETRKCDRIILDDAELADLILQKVKPFIDPEIVELDPDVKDPNGGSKGIGKRVLTFSRGAYRGKWRLTRLNERLRFLKYGQGEYFRSHWDGSYVTPDKKQRSFFTLHVYLNDATNPDPSSNSASAASALPLIGGATRFWSTDMQDYLDVEPRVGRVLVFQHSGFLHSGEEVQQGIKLTVRTDLMYERIA